MRSVLTLIAVLTVIAAIGALSYGGYAGVMNLWQVYAGLEDVTRVVLLSALSVALIGALIVSGAIKSAGAKAGRNSLAESKLRLYRSLVEIYRPCFDSPDEPAQPVYSEVLGNLDGIETEMQILASGYVLEIHGKLEAALRKREDREPAKALFRQLIKVIRRDLGHGSGYEESKLKFLIESNRGEGVEPSGHGVSA